MLIILIDKLWVFDRLHGFWVNSLLLRNSWYLSIQA